MITGSTGLIGKQIVDILCDASTKVKVVSLDKIKVNEQAEHVFGDITNIEFCKDITKDIDFVFHLAGIKGLIEVTKKKPTSFFVPFLTMNINRINKVQKVVYISSIGAYASAEVFKETEDLDGLPMDMFPG